MSNVTFMIGNGFDLACGLKSRYTDTYDSYCASKSSSPIIDKFKSTIEKDIQTWADFEMQLVQYAKELGSEDEITECLRDYDAYLNDYLLIEQNRFWEENKEIEGKINPVIREMGRSLSRFYLGLTKNDIQRVSSVFRRDHRVNYHFINYNYTNVFDRLMKSAFDNNAVTDTFLSSFSHSEVLHIHGTLGNDVTLGVDNEGQLEDLPYTIAGRAKRVLIKPAFLQAFDNNRLEAAVKTILSSDIICIFGLSLGDSDLTWRRVLEVWLKSEKDRHLVYYNHGYMNKVYHSTAITRKMDDEEDGKEHLIHRLFGDSLDEETKAEIIDKIHIPVGTRIFNIRQAIDEVTKTEQMKSKLKQKLDSVDI